jgi:hypothetical protein
VTRRKPFVLCAATTPKHNWSTQFGVAGLAGFDSTGLTQKGIPMRNSVRNIVTAAALTGALAVVTATPSQAQWYGRGWGWGAPIAAGIGLLAGAVASAVAGPAYYYGGYYGYPAYGYNNGWGYPAYGYGYGGPVYAPGYGYDVDYGYGGPVVYAGYGSGYGYAAPSYYGSYPSYAYRSPYYRAYGLVRRYGAGPVYARARTSTAERSYALAPRPRVQEYAHYRAPAHRVNTAGTDRLTRSVANLARPPMIRATAIKASAVSRSAGVPAAAKVQRGIRSASASEGAYR